MNDPDRVIPFRRRSDLVAASTSLPGQPAEWTVKDPLRLQYFRMRAEEYAIFDSLDGSTSFSELLEKLNRRFPGGGVTLASVAGFISTLVKSGLLCATSVGFGRRLADTNARARRNARWQSFASLISVRTRGVDPDRFLRFIQPVTRLLLSPPILVGCCAVIVAAITVVVSRMETIAHRLPDLSYLTSPANLPVLMGTIVVIKILHELGHAIACRHFGGECHELGIVLIVLLPLLYCDVTDSWMHARKWPRVAISLAGIFVELTLAAVCTFLWLMSVPGPENLLFLNVMIVCSLNTLLFNGNPLLRYDGYYVLSDLTGIPNLGAESREVVWSVFDRFVLGVESGATAIPRGRWLFLFVFGIASTVYRLFVLAAILWMLHATLSGFGLAPLAWIIGAPTVVLTVAMPILKLFVRARSIAAADRRSENDVTSVTGGLSIEPPKSSSRRAGLGALVFVAALAGMLFVPLPHRVYAPFVLQPDPAGAVFVTVPGRIVSAVPPGSVVSTGDVLATLRNPELERELDSVRSEVHQLELRLTHLQARQSSNRALGAQIPATRNSLNSARRRLTRVRRRVGELTLRAPFDGVVAAPRNRVAETESLDARTWIGTPLDQENRGALLSEQTLLCHIVAGPPIAVLMVDQEDLEHVHAEQSAVLQFRSDPRRTIRGRVTEVATVASEEPPREIIAAGLMTPEAAGSARTWGVTYQARVEIEDGNPAPLNSPGTARIQIEPASLMQRLIRTARRVFAVGEE